MKKSILSALVGASLLFTACGTKEEKTTETKDSTSTETLYIRKNAHSPEAKADLEAYEKAFAKMRTLGCKDPLSWYYQGAIHNIPDYEQFLKAKGDSLCPEFKGENWPGWATCPHMKPGLEQYHFLTWHRLYLYYLEKIVRKHSGKADFALPYWNYNNSAQRTLPEAFRTGNASTNGLYEDERSPSLMAGDTIDATGTDAIVMNVQILGKDTIVVVEPTVAMGAILDTGYLWTSSDIHHFSYELEDVVHNCMHDYVGADVKKSDIAQLGKIYNRIYQRMSNDPEVGEAMMGMVPSSAFDPIFFLHHGNLDRLWMAWELDHPNLALTFEEFEKAGFKVEYTFFNEDGKEVHYTSLQQVYDTIRNIDYTYDYLHKSKKTTALLKKGKPVKVNAKASLATLAPKTKLGKTASVFTLTLPEALTTHNDENTFYELELEVLYAKHPKSRMAVMIQGKTPQKGEPLKNYLVGWLGFFGASHADGAHKGDEHAHKGTTGDKIYKLDVTEELKQQNALGQKQFKVVLQMDNPDPKNPVTVKSLALKSYQKQ